MFEDNLDAAFDASLRLENRQWGARDVEAVAEAGRVRGLHLIEVIEMPANKLTIVFERAGFHT